MGGEITYTQTPFCSRINISFTILTAVFFNDTIAAVAFLCNLLKGTITIIYGVAGLHFANLLKKYNISLESEKKLTYNENTMYCSILVEKYNLIKAINGTVNRLSDLPCIHLNISGV
jgi:hypothetical protein